MTHSFPKDASSKRESAVSAVRAKLCTERERNRKQEHEICRLKFELRRLRDSTSDIGTRTSSVADPDPNFFHPGSRVRIKYLSILTQNVVSKLSEIGMGLFISDPDSDFLPFPGPGVIKAPDPGSATLERRDHFTDYHCVCPFV